MTTLPKIAPIEPSIFDDDDDGWQDMPVVRDDNPAELDEEDKKKYHYRPTEKKDVNTASNATGNLLEVDYLGDAWRAKVDQNESDYTRLRLDEEDESDEVHLRTRYLFDEDKAMTPLSQMQQTKDMLTEAQRVAYVGLCALAAREMADSLRVINRGAKHKELGQAIKNMELWALKIMGRLYYHMELATEEQKMIESLALHGIQAKDLIPSLMTTHTVANPEYDPAEAKKQQDLQEDAALQQADQHSEDISDDIPDTPTTAMPKATVPEPPSKPVQTTARVLEATSTTIPGVSTHLSAADKNVTLDIRWTVLCDLFLILVADSVYDARSRVLLENVALKLGLGWLDIVKFERRVTEALDIQEEVDSLEAGTTIEEVKKKSKKRRYMMLGLATLGGGLVIGLSAGLLAPVIGAGLGAAFATVGITGTTGFLAGAGGAAVITTGGVLTGSSIAVRGMARRTQYVRTFDILPLHNNKRVSCILTVPGFLTSDQDDPRLPFSVLDPVIGDVFSVLWEPEMIRETGSALKILTTEVLTQIGQTVLQATVMTALMSALQWPIILTKLGYLIDNPWSNALDRAKSAGRVLADVLIHRHLGVRPITLIGFSLGGRVIFYALLELARQQAFGIVQDVFILGTTVTAPTKTWIQARSAVAGRFVNGYARNDWVLNYLFRATSGDLNTVAGLRPIRDVPALENVDVTDKISGHMSYRTFMPLILDQLGFPVSADYFDEPVEPDFEGDRIVVREENQPKKRSWFSRKKKTPPTSAKISRPPSVSSFPSHHKKSSSASTQSTEDDLPPREATPVSMTSPTSRPTTPIPPGAGKDTPASPSATDSAKPDEAQIPKYAGFDLAAIKATIDEAEHNPEELRMPAPTRFQAPPIPTPISRPESAPPPLPKSPQFSPRSTTPTNARVQQPVAAPSSSHDDLPPAFSRAMSLNHVSMAAQREDEEEEDLGSHNKQLSAARREALQSFSPQPASLSFGNAYGSAWSAEPKRTPPGYGSPFSDFQDETTFGKPSNSFASPRPPDVQYYRPPESEALSFGGVDGSITFSPASRLEPPDPWNVAPSTLGSYNAKKSSSALNFNLNPWQS